MKSRLGAPFWLVLVCAALLLTGGRAQEPTLNPAAATFKKEINSCLTNLSAALVEPVANRDQAGIAAALEKTESPAVMLCRLCPFRIVVLNPGGETLADYPARAHNQVRNFSRYDLFIKVVNSKKTQQQRFFLQNGSELYMISAPLLQQEKVIGLVAIAINSEDAEKKWGLKGKDFLFLDFDT